MANVKFQLDTAAGAEILEKMAMPTIEKSGRAIAARAQTIASSISSDPPEFEVNTVVGKIRRGTRAIATVRANPDDEHQAYIAHVALSKAKDAGRVN